MKLGLCRDCRRHARVTEGACPFCGGAIDAPLLRALPAGTAVTRAALLGASLALTACSSEAIYGAPVPPADAAADADSGIVAIYGAPSDAGAFDAMLDEETGPMADYGAPPPPPDAGK